MATAEVPSAMAADGAATAGDTSADGLGLPAATAAARVARAYCSLTIPDPGRSYRLSAAVQATRLNWARGMILAKRKADAAACAGSREVHAFAIGQWVECRDRGEAWSRGVVTSQHPLEVELAGHLQGAESCDYYTHPYREQDSFGWDEVRCVCGAVPPVRCSVGCALGHLLPEAVQRCEVNLSYLLLARPAQTRVLLCALRAHVHSAF